MNLRRSLSTVRLLTLGLLIALLGVGPAQAAPVYQGKFALPYAVRWGQAVLPRVNIGSDSRTLAGAYSW
jgi:hypothetical protein